MADEVETYVVTGPNPFRGNEPGEQFDATPDASIERAQARGSVKVLGAEGDEDEFKGLKRDELNTLAANEGVEDPAKLPNIPAVIEAIQEAREGATANGGDE